MQSLTLTTVGAVTADSGGTPGNVLDGTGVSKLLGFS